MKASFGSRFKAKGQFNKNPNAVMIDQAYSWISLTHGPHLIWYYQVWIQPRSSYTQPTLFNAMPLIVQSCQALTRTQASRTLTEPVQAYTLTGAGLGLLAPFATPDQHM